MLQFEKVTKTFHGPQGEVPALNRVSFRVEPGEVVAVCGPSGCGKSTLLLTAGTLLGPDSGLVRIDGVDPYRLTPDARSAFRASAVGFVFQQFHLVPYLSVIENILLPSVVQPSADSEKRACELMARLGLEHRARHVPSQLSMGEQQRTALARALLNRPRILLADEPTGNLDPENGAIVLNELEAFAEAGGAVLLVTHEPSASTRAARVLTMEAGCLAPGRGAATAV